MPSKMGYQQKPRESLAHVSIAESTKLKNRLPLVATSLSSSVFFFALPLEGLSLSSHSSCGFVPYASLNMGVGQDSQVVYQPADQRVRESVASFSCTFSSKNLKI